MFTVLLAFLPWSKHQLSSLMEWSYQQAQHCLEQEGARGKGRLETLVHDEFPWVLNLLFPLQSREEAGNLENSAQEPIRGRQWHLTCWGALEEKIHSMYIIQPQFPACLSREGRTQAHKSTHNAIWILESLFHNLSDPILTCKRCPCGETGRAAAALARVLVISLHQNHSGAAQQNE